MENRTFKLTKKALLRPFDKSVPVHHDRDVPTGRGFINFTVLIITVFDPIGHFLSRKQMRARCSLT
jgi:hypothetical protein